ncbi:hypothetical protein PybrP1_001638, partial [[Pythium] brassicae (nom. inval.)]
MYGSLAFMDQMTHVTAVSPSLLQTHAHTGERTPESATPSSSARSNSQPAAKALDLEMVAPIVRLAAVACAAVVLLPHATLAAPITTNPVTPVGDIAPLNHDHPAFGARLSKRAAKAVVLSNPIEDAILADSGLPVTTASTATVTAANVNSVDGTLGLVHAQRARVLEDYPRDLEKLENFFEEKMESNFDVIDAKYRSAARKMAPWPGSYWPIAKDKYGRYVDPLRRDIGAGFFHIALTNVMGKYGKAVVLDVDNSDAVWNMPVRSYEVTRSELVDVAAGSLAEFGTEEYPFNPDAKYLVYTTTSVKWIVEAQEDGPLVSTGRVDSYTRTNDYTYFLELDDSKNIIGGEWLGKSNADHPDFLWLPTGSPTLGMITSTGVMYKEVRQLLDASIACVEIPSPTPVPTTPVPTKAVPTPTPTTVVPSSIPTSETPASSKPTPSPETPAGGKPTPSPETPA